MVILGLGEKLVDILLMNTGRWVLKVDGGNPGSKGNAVLEVKLLVWRPWADVPKEIAGDVGGYTFFVMNISYFLSFI